MFWAAAALTAVALIGGAIAVIGAIGLAASFVGVIQYA